MDSSSLRTDEAARASRASRRQQRRRRRVAGRRGRRLPGVARGPRGTSAPASPAEDDGVVDDEEEEEDARGARGREDVAARDGSKVAATPAPEAAWARSRGAGTRRATRLRQEHGRRRGPPRRARRGLSHSWGGGPTSLERGARSLLPRARARAAESSVARESGGGRA